MEIGTTLSHYRITAKLGEGGMGEVYRADDTRLKREVAIKVLPAALAADPDRLARLEREAQVLAQLEHPNVAAIYGLEEATAVAPSGPGGAVAEPGGDDPTTTVRFLVMQLADGDTLDELLDQHAGVTGSGDIKTAAVTAGVGASGSTARGRGLPLDEVLSIAGAIAEALEAAHDKRIVHRDLKPANIKVAFADGVPKVKVLDFGLAKALQPEGSTTDASADLSASPTMVVATGSGMVMGTAGYMSPEQARGQRVDKRSDVWAFGAVVYEMLTGERLFQGETVSDTLAAVLRDDVQLDALPADTPLPLRRLLRRCLQRDVRRRLKDMGDARLEIEAAAAGPLGDEAADVALLLERAGGATSGSASASGSGMARAGGFGWLHAVAAVVLLAAGAVFAWFAMPAVSTGERPVRAFIAGPVEARGAVISPDGTMLLLRFDEQLWIRDIDSLDTRSVESSEGAGTAAFWSPDSSQVAFFVGADLHVAAASGIGTRRLAYDQLRNFGGTWGENGIIVSAWGYEARGGLVMLPLDGAEPTVVARAPAAGFLRFPTLLPDGRTLVYNFAERGEGVFAFGKMLVQHGLDPDAEVDVILDEPRGFSRSVYIEPLELLVIESDASELWTIPLPREDFRADGPLQPLPYAGQWPSFADDGTFVYRSASQQLDFEPLHWVDRGGEIIETIRHEMLNPRWLSLSPDGTRLATRAPREVGLTYDIWVFDLERGAQTLITPEPGAGNTPDWLDAERLVYAGRTPESSRGAAPSRTLLVQAASGAGDAEPIAEGSAFRRPSASRDGRYIVYEELSLEGEFTRRGDRGAGPPGGDEGDANEPAGGDDASVLPAAGRRGGEGRMFGGGGGGEQRGPPGATWDIYYLATDGGVPQPFMITAESELRPTLSPDAGRIAFISDASGSNEAWVSTFPEASELVRISVRGAGYVRWSADGREIFYDDGAGVLWSVSVDPAAPHGRAAYGQPERLFGEAELNTEFDYYGTRGWDVGPSGERFLIVQRYLDDTSQVHVIENFPRWYREQRR